MVLSATLTTTCITPRGGAGSGSTPKGKGKGRIRVDYCGQFLKEKKCDYEIKHGYCPKAHLNKEQIDNELKRRKEAAEKYKSSKSEGKGDKAT